MHEGKLQGVQEQDRSKTVLKKREKTPVWQIRGDCNCKTTSPQRYTQEPLINNDIYYKKLNTNFVEKIPPSIKETHNTFEKYAHDRITTHERGRKEICEMQKLIILFYFQFSICLFPLRHGGSRQKQPHTLFGVTKETDLKIEQYRLKTSVKN